MELDKRVGYATVSALRYILETAIKERNELGLPPNPDDIIKYTKLNDYFKRDDVK